MAAGFIALSDDDIDATSFQPERVGNSRRRRHDAATSRLDPGQPRRVRKARMKTHHFRFSVLHDTMIKAPVGEEGTSVEEAHRSVLRAAVLSPKPG
jgi:hypothetical protein